MLSLNDGVNLKMVLATLWYDRELWVIILVLEQLKTALKVSETPDMGKPHTWCPHSIYSTSTNRKGNVLPHSDYKM